MSDRMSQHRQHHLLQRHHARDIAGMRTSHYQTSNIHSRVRSTMNIRRLIFGSVLMWILYICVKNNGRHYPTRRRPLWF
jgi:hypothetical protein